MSRSIQRKIAFLQDCDRMRQSAQKHQELIDAQHMGHMGRVLASKEAFRKFRQTGDCSEILRLKRLGIWVDTVL